MNTHRLTPAEVRRGSQAFRSHERRSAMYKVATFLIDHFWGAPADMADALGVLLLTWNQALYRFGSFDFASLEHVLHENLTCLGEYRAREILSLTEADAPAIEALFGYFLDALRIADGKKKGARSPVAVAKALHLLAPRFFPLWDDKIAKAYNCRYSTNPIAKYLAFMWITKSHAADLHGKIDVGDSSILKIIDEYNYAKFTRNWL